MKTRTQRKRKYVKPDWKAINWSLSDPEIVQMTGISQPGVMKARNRHAPDSRPLQYMVGHLEKHLDEVGVPTAYESGERMSTHARILAACQLLQHHNRVTRLELALERGTLASA